MPYYSMNRKLNVTISGNKVSWQDITNVYDIDKKVAQQQLFLSLHKNN